MKNKMLVLAQKISVLSLIVCLLMFVFVDSVYLQAEDVITITTYYPAPYGVYNELEVMSGLAIGDISGSGITLDDGETFVQDSAVFKQLVNDPDNPKTGEIYYNSAGYFKYYDGANWIRIGMPLSGCYMAYCDGVTCSFGGTLTEPCVGGFQDVSPTFYLACHVTGNTGYYFSYHNAYCGGSSGSSFLCCR